MRNDRQSVASLQQSKTGADNSGAYRDKLGNYRKIVFKRCDGYDDSLYPFLKGGK